MADDSRADVFVVCEALRKSGVDAEIHVARDGEQTIRFLDEADANPAAPCPDLILLDINMPRYKGGDVLRHLRGSARCGKALVLIVTSSDLVEDREEMERLGANGYFRKPSEVSEVLKLGQRVRELLALSDPAGSA